MFCAPTATFEALHAAVTVGSNTGEGKRAISSRSWPATSGKKASTKALASAGVLYIFQLAAIRALRGILSELLRLILVDGIGGRGDGGHSPAEITSSATFPSFRGTPVRNLLRAGCGGAHRSERCKEGLPSSRRISWVSTAHSSKKRREGRLTSESCFSWDSPAVRHFFPQPGQSRR